MSDQDIKQCLTETKREETLILMKYRAIVYKHIWKIESKGLAPTDDMYKCQGFGDSVMLYSNEQVPIGEIKEYSLQMMGIDSQGWEDEENIGLILRMKRDIISQGKTKKLFKFSAWVIDSHGRQTHYITDSGPFSAAYTEVNESESTFIYAPFLSFDQLIDLFVDDTLTIGCQVEVISTDEPPYAADDVALPFPKAPKSCQSFDMGELFKQGTFSDITLVVAEEKFPVHRVILASRSPVFSAMFVVDMQEKKDGNVEIHDFSADVIEDMLTYIYTDIAPNISKLAKDLLRAAEKYMLPDLKCMCEVTLASQATVENAAKFLMMADMHNAAELKSMILHRVVRQAKRVLETDGWKELTETTPHLVLEVLGATIDYVEQLSAAEPSCGQNKQMKMELRTI